MTRPPEGAARAAQRVRAGGPKPVRCRQPKPRGGPREPCGSRADSRPPNRTSTPPFPFKTTSSEIRNPDGTLVFQNERVEVPEAWSQVASGHPGPEVLPQARRAAPAEAGRGGRRAGLPLALGAGRGGAGRAARVGALRRRGLGQAGLQPAGRHLDLLGLEGRLLRHRGGRPRLLRRALRHAGAADVRAQLAAVVQHRPALGLRHRRPQPGPLLRRLPQRRTDQGDRRLRAPAAARLLHPVGRGRPGERRRHHGSLDPRGAAVQVRLWHRLQLLAGARLERAAGPAAAAPQA